MRSTFSSIMHKRIYTLNFDRASEPDPNMYRKLQNAIRTMGVVISTPTAVKSIMLKYIEVGLIVWHSCIMTVLCVSCAAPLTSTTAFARIRVVSFWT